MTETCSWTSSNRDGVDLTPWVARDLLVDTYRTRLYSIFEPVEIEGLPAVIQKSAPDSSSCTITTGIADGQALETILTIGEVREGRPVGDPCVEARKVVEAVVSNLPPLR